MIRHRVPPPSNANISSDPESVAYRNRMVAGQPEFREVTIETAHARYMKEKEKRKPEVGYWGKIRAASPLKTGKR